MCVQIVQPAGMHYVSNILEYTMHILEKQCATNGYKPRPKDIEYLLMCHYYYLPEALKYEIVRIC